MTRRSQLVLALAIALVVASGVESVPQTGTGSATSSGSGGPTWFNKATAWVKAAVGAGGSNPTPTPPPPTPHHRPNRGPPSGQQQQHHSGNWLDQGVNWVKSKLSRNSNSQGQPQTGNTGVSGRTRRGPPHTHNAPDVEPTGIQQNLQRMFDKLGVTWNPLHNIIAALGGASAGRSAFKAAERGQSVKPAGAPSSGGRVKRASVGGQSSLPSFLQVAAGTPQPTGGQCGPDVTQWLVDQMNTNMNHRVIRTNRENAWAMWIPGFNIGWHTGFLLDFKNLVKAGAPWDFKATVNFQAGGCPTDCPRSVTLCGICMSNDVPGNIHYGWVGRAGRIRAWFLHNRADAAQAGGVDDPRDRVAVQIGIDMWDGTATLCDKIRARQQRMLLRSHCRPCSTRFR